MFIECKLFLYKQSIFALLQRIYTGREDFSTLVPRLLSPLFHPIYHLLKQKTSDLVHCISTGPRITFRPGSLYIYWSLDYLALCSILYIICWNRRLPTWFTVYSLVPRLLTPLFHPIHNLLSHRKLLTWFTVYLLVPGLLSDLVHCISTGPQITYPFVPSYT